jgi:hypothetical protein
MQIAYLRRKNATERHRQAKNVFITHATTPRRQLPYCRVYVILTWRNSGAKYIIRVENFKPSHANNM